MAAHGEVVFLRGENSTDEEPIDNQDDPDILETGQPYFEIIEGGSVKGKDLLVDNIGYSYTLKRSCNKKTEWRCQYRNGCSATVIQDENIFHFGKNPHNHPGEDYILHKVKIARDVKNLVAIEENTPVKDIVNEVLARQDPTLPPECLPARENLIRNATRVRQIQNPIEVQEIFVYEETLDNLPFCETTEHYFELVEGGSMRGKDLLVESIGYSYSLKRTFRKRKEWRCTCRRYEKKECRGTVFQDDNVFYIGKSPHNHPAQPNLVQKVTLIRDIKKLVAIEVNTPVPVLVRDMLARQDPTVSPIIPNPDNLIRSLNRQRQLARESSQVVVSENDSDIWDDTALIEAYDNAVSNMKKSLGVADDPPPQQLQTSGVAGSNEDQQQPKPAKKRKNKNNANRKKKKNQKNNNPNPQWKVGDHCQAIFTEDGVLYNAVILSIDPARQSCMVRYTEYGNEEEQLLTGLFNTSSFAIPETAHSESETESIQSSAASNCSSQTLPRPGAPTPPPWSTSPQTSFPGFGQMPGMMPPFPGFPGGTSLPSMPAIPPPPPMFDDDVATDKEALYSMLMSWYMSGYHSGYYQGLKHSQLRSAGRRPGSNRAQRRKDLKRPQPSQKQSQDKGPMET